MLFLIGSSQKLAAECPQYDDEHFPDIGANITDVEMVEYLMKSHHLHQKDLADIFGRQGNDTFSRENDEKRVY